MRRRSRAASNPVKSGGNHASKRKPRKAPTQRASAADPQEQIESLKRERDEALEQQTATSEILAVISKSLTDTQPAFDAIVQSGLRLFPNATVTVVLANAGMITAAAIAAPDSARVEAWRRTFPYPLTRQYMHGRAILDCELVDFPDVEKTPAELAVGAKNFLSSGHRAITIMPMIRGDGAIGAISVVRLTPGPLSDKQLAVLRTFANQAVIVIENTRLLSEFRESLQQQMATSEVLSVISSTPGELEPVFKSMLTNATRLCEASYGTLWLREGDGFRTAAIHGALPPAWINQWQSGTLFHPGPDVPLELVDQTRKPMQVPDMSSDPSYLAGDPLPVSAVEVAGIRTLLVVPMLKESELVGAIGIYRREVKPFIDNEVELVKNFAAQAVIAIENARLLNELRQRTDDLSEALEQQTATSEVLKVISSSPGDLEPVFNAMLENATKICDAKFGNLLFFEKGAFRRVALYGAMPEFANDSEHNPIVESSALNPISRLITTKQAIHVTDIAAERGYLERDPVVTALVEKAGARTIMSVPMLKENELVGAIGIYRQEVRPFTEKQIELLKNFAAQAVIAIENARLLNELRESLQQQTATSEILTVISRSPTDVKPVFEIIGERAEKLCDAEVSVVSMVDGELIQLASIHGVSEEGVAAVRNVYPMRRDNETITARTVRTAAVVHVPDVFADPSMKPRMPPALRTTAHASGYR